MNGIEIALALLLGLVVNEFSDLSPWLARTLVAWSARLRYGDTARADIRAEELAALINDRPGKLFKLATGIRFASAALAVRLRRLASNQPQPVEGPAPDDLLSSARRFLPMEFRPSLLVERYLFPSERFRGEWRRHPIHLAKSFVVIAGYAVLGSWATIRRIKPQYVDRIVAAIIIGAVLLAALRVLGWYLGRFVITNKRLMSTEGVFFRRVSMIPLLRVTDMRYVQSPLGRLLNYGTFRLESASRRNALRKIVDLPNPNQLYLRLVEEMYEPAAVDARLAGAPESPLDHEDGPRFDPAAVQREIIDQIGTLSAQLAALATAVQRLDPAPESGHEAPTVGSAAAQVRTRP